MGGARARHGIHLDASGAGDMAAEPRLVTAVASPCRVDAAAADSKAKLEAVAMATGGLRVDGPVSVERLRHYGRSGTDDCGRGRQSDGANTIAGHASPPVSFVAVQFPVERYRYSLTQKRHGLASVSCRVLRMVEMAYFHERPASVKIFL